MVWEVYESLDNGISKAGVCSFLLDGEQEIDDVIEERYNINKKEKYEMRRDLKAIKNIKIRKIVESRLKVIEDYVTLFDHTTFKKLAEEHKMTVSSNYQDFATAKGRLSSIERQLKSPYSAPLELANNTKSLFRTIHAYLKSIPEPNSPKVACYTLEVERDRVRELVNRMTQDGTDPKISAEISTELKERIKRMKELAEIADSAFGLKLGEDIAAMGAYLSGAPINFKLDEIGGKIGSVLKI